MYSIDVERGSINTALLEQELRAQCGDLYFGLSTRPGFVTLFLSDQADVVLLDAARRLVELHDASRLTEAQVKAIAERTALESARRNTGSVLDPNDFRDDALLLRLAEKITWLEREIRDLRGLSGSNEQLATSETTVTSN
jgi:hypothetical protein